MVRKLLVLMKQNWIFYRRNKFLWAGLAYVFALIGILFLSGSFTLDRFDSISEMMNVFHRSIFILALIAGVTSISIPISQRALKTILAKPVSLRLWLLSHYLSGFMFCFGWGLLCIVVVPCMFWIFHIPFQVALFPSVLVMVLYAYITFVYILALSTFLHPLVAFFAYFLLQPEIYFYLLNELHHAEFSSAWGKVSQKILEWVMAIFAYTLPDVSPLNQRLETMIRSLELYTGWGKDLGVLLSYTFLLTVFFFLLSHKILQRRRLW